MLTDSYPNDTRAAGTTDIPFRNTSASWILSLGDILYIDPQIAVSTNLCRILSTTKSRSCGANATISAALCAEKRFCAVDRCVCRGSFEYFFLPLDFLVKTVYMLIYNMVYG
jgi:hypothetical protein